MAIDIEVRLPRWPGTLLGAAEALGHAGVNIEGACGYEAGECGTMHLLVLRAETARRSLLNADVEIVAERPVVMIEVDNRPGGGAAVLRRVADAGVNVDLLYTTLDGRLVLGSPDIDRLRAVVTPAV